MPEYARLPVHKLKTTTAELNLGDAKVYHLPDWQNLTHPQRLTVIRQIAMMRGRDARIARVVVGLLKRSGARPRQYGKQAAAILKWVQDPENVYYVNEPGERLQDPVYTIKAGHGDCFAEDTLVLRRDFRLVPIQDIEVGDLIWGKDRWTAVVNRWEKGRLPVTEIELNNGSVVRLTEGHKVYVQSCCGPEEKGHGPQCAAKASQWAQCVTRYGSKEVRLRVSELTEGMQLLQPEKIEQDGELWADSEGAWLSGAYIAEGWHEKSRVMISGKDGHWKEATKHRVKAYAEARGWAARWDKKYIAVNSVEAVAFCAEAGNGALNKRIPPHLLARADLGALDEGLKLDASQNTRGEGWTFSTVSKTLAVQYRVLQRMQGRSTSMRMVTEHGGYGTNPIYRVGVRNPTTSGDRRLVVKTLRRDAAEIPCYDIATDDHYVYLPEADCTVSNCDDQVILLAAMFESVGLPWKLVLSGRGPAGEKVRFIEGQPVPPGVAWTHIYCMVGTPPYRATQWYFCEPTVEGVPLGWDVISGDHRYLPEMSFNATGGEPQIVAAPPYKEVYGDSYGNSAGLVGGTIAGTLAQEEDAGGMVDWTKIGQAVITGVLVSVGTSLLLNWINGNGLWEGEGSAVHRWRKIPQPTRESVLIAPSPTGAKV